MFIIFSFFVWTAMAVYCVVYDTFLLFIMNNDNIYQTQGKLSSGTLEISYVYCSDVEIFPSFRVLIIKTNESLK